MTDRKMKAAKAAFDTSVDCGITFFDTAEVYGSRVGKWFCFNYFLELITSALHNNNLLIFFFILCSYRCLLVLSALKLCSEGTSRVYSLLVITT